MLTSSTPHPQNKGTHHFTSLHYAIKLTRFMWLQTLPDIVQARIISFLTYDHAKFNKHDLTKLAREVLSNTNVEHWVKKAAQQLLDVVSDSNYKWVSSLNLDSEEETLEGEFGGVPEWLKNVASDSDSVLPWLPVSVDELNSREPNKKLVHHEVVPVDHETEETAACLKTRLLNMESSLKAAELVDDIHKLCLKRKKDSLTILNLIEPWNANDEIVPVLLSGLLDEKEDDFILTSNILCSVLLPKLLVLEKPASRVLLTAAIPYCKVHHKAAVYAVLFPLILHKDGINNPICDVITRIIKECLHPAHASAFCQKLLCEREVDENEYICIPSYQHLVSKNLVWTEPLFNLFHNILNHNVHLTQDSVDRLVFHVQEASRRFPASLKFANFLLCFVSKCAPLLKVHKVALSEAVGNTSSFLTKSILSKLDSI
ncbi:hypothetical protein CTI12_AA030230 [Artemisia annua]|uniref:Uncharacterized protein n=1 Tax=Artemisia annua TaxID=35608 RepID=A0A2U1QE52_ARTAN|nr:hypothetical protein CTI12_AA030230 [Artemisia annua]